MSDEQLVKRSLKGDQKAIATLYDRYVGAMYRYCFYQLGDEAIAQDLSHDVFIEMIHSLSSFSGNGSFKNWLYTIAKRLVLSKIREKYELPKAQLGDWLPAADDPTWIDPDHQQEFKEQQLEKLLATLTPTERHILTLTKLQGYTSREAADVTGKTPESIRVIAHRAIAKLKKMI